MINDQLTEIENVLFHLNYRWNLEAYSLWKGGKIPFKAYQIYKGYDDFINLETMNILDRGPRNHKKLRLKHALIDHYLQRALLPHETEMRTWMRGAASHVSGKKIFFSDIISWCQKESTFEKRKILQRETGPLCKFLKPFALNYWNILLEILSEDLGFHNYLDYCRQKKGIHYKFYYHALKGILHDTDVLYFKAMDRWARDRFNKSLDTLTRFDAINLLGLGQFDRFFPCKNLESLTSFFKFWSIDIENLTGLNLELGREEEKSPQAICFILQIPDEVYVLMKPQGGWIDLETLWHELGHGLSAVFTSPELSVVDREMATSFCLSETYAFLFHNMSFSMPFLMDFLGLKRTIAEELQYYKALKDLSLFRRYAAKFLIEYEMFYEGDLHNGERYSRMMTRYTGFYYQPESHLFDLIPELYSLEYVLAWMATPILEGYLKEMFGTDWIFNHGTGKILKKWWLEGNRYDIFKFLAMNGLGELRHEMLLERWRNVLAPYIKEGQEKKG
ncbi:MAG: hypothetical protein SV375_01625 [Thermodesulfobacteriota bacterium]|nr:hypothetical protein [Thermodesulfobacteriota bacterium]